MTIDFSKLFQSYIDSGLTMGELANQFTKAMNDFEKKQKEKEAQEKREAAAAHRQAQIEKERMTVLKKIQEKKFDLDFAASALMLYWIEVLDNEKKRFANEKEFNELKKSIKDLVNSSTKLLRDDNCWLDLATSIFLH